MHRLAPAALFLLTLLAPAADAQAGEPQVDSVFPTLDQVDLVGDAGGRIWLRVTARDDAGVVHVSAEFVRQPPCAPASFLVDFSPVQNAKRVLQRATSTQPEISQWNHNFSVDDTRLTTCDWRLYFRAHDAQGRVRVQPVDDDGPEYIVQVEAEAVYPGAPDCPGAAVDPTPPALCLVNTGHSAEQAVPTRVVDQALRLRSGEFLTFNLTMLAPQRVTYEQRFGAGSFLDELPIGPATNRSGLHSIPHGALAEGKQELIVRAYSRILAEPTLTIHLKNLTVDREAPLIPRITVPKDVYRDVGFPIQVNVRDALPHVVLIRVQHRDGWLADEQQGNSTLANTTHPFNVILDENGPYLITVRVTDEVGNRHVSFHNLTVVSPYTKLLAGTVQQLNDTPLAGEVVGFELPITQTEGLLDIEVDVTFAVGARTGTDSAVIGPGNTTRVRHEGVYPPGRHTLDVTVVPPALWQVRDGSRLTRSIDFEVFLGAVVDGAKVYWIRANERGLPGSAVRDPDLRNEKVYDLEPAQNGTRTLYTFEADGITYTWDPFQHNERGQSVTTARPSPTATPREKDSPAPAAVLVLLVLAAAVALARRRGA